MCPWGEQLPIELGSSPARQSCCEVTRPGGFLGTRARLPGQTPATSGCNFHTSAPDHAAQCAAHSTHCQLTSWAQRADPLPRSQASSGLTASWHGTVWVSVFPSRGPLGSQSCVAGPHSSTSLGRAGSHLVPSVPAQVYMHRMCAEAIDGSFQMSTHCDELEHFCTPLGPCCSRG